MVNPVEGKIVIDVSRKYVSIFRCDGEGKVLDDDHFAFPFRLDRKDAIEEANDLYAVVFDWLNDTINGGYEADEDDSARGDGPPAKTE